MNATSPKVNAPWESDDCFPEKPPGHDYGYLEKGKFVGCSREKLIERCSGLDLPEIELVWHPETLRLVPVRATVLLKDALRDREHATLKHNAKIAAFNVLVFVVGGLATHHHKEYFVLAVFFAFFTGVLPLFESWRELRNFDQTDWDSVSQITPYDRYVTWIVTRSTTVTWSLLVLISVLWAIETLTGTERATLLAGLMKRETWDGQWWRIFTAPLLHGNFPHFLFNASALWGLGRLTEALAGRYRLAIVFAFSAIGGGLFSLFFTYSSSVGASGGLLGLIGFLLVLGARRRSVLPPGFVRIFWINVALVAVMGIVAHGVVDNAAHLGGFLFGVWAGALMIPAQGSLPLPASRTVTALGVLSFIGTVGAALFAACKILKF